MHSCMWFNDGLINQFKILSHDWIILSWMVYYVLNSEKDFH